jgi:YfiH family protein
MSVLKEKGLKIIFSTKKEGSMKIGDKEGERNREKFLKKVGIDKDIVVFIKGCHGKRIKKVSKKDKGKIVEGFDGLITKEKGIFLGITFGDCLPVFLWDKEKRVISLLHCGWRGIAKGIVEEGVKKMKEFGIKPRDVFAFLGPGICKKHYEIKEDVLEKFKNYKSAITFKQGKIFLDLKKVVKEKLKNLGVKYIFQSKECTFCQKQKYFSLRRDKKLRVQVALFGMEIEN